MILMTCISLTLFLMTFFLICAQKKSYGKERKKRVVLGPQYNLNTEFKRQKKNVFTTVLFQEYIVNEIKGRVYQE